MFVNGVWWLFVNAISVSNYTFFARDVLWANDGLVETIFSENEAIENTDKELNIDTCVRTYDCFLCMYPIID